VEDNEDKKLHNKGSRVKLLNEDLSPSPLEEKKFELEVTENDNDGKPRHTHSKYRRKKILISDSPNTENSDSKHRPRAISVDAEYLKQKKVSKTPTLQRIPDNTDSDSRRPSESDDTNEPSSSDQILSSDQKKKQ